MPTDETLDPEARKRAFEALRRDSPVVQDFLADKAKKLPGSILEGASDAALFFPSIPGYAERIGGTIAEKAMEPDKSLGEAWSEADKDATLPVFNTGDTAAGVRSTISGKPYEEERQIQQEAEEQLTDPTERGVAEFVAGGGVQGAGALGKLAVAGAKKVPAAFKNLKGVLGKVGKVPEKLVIETAKATADKAVASRQALEKIAQIEPGIKADIEDLISLTENFPAKSPTEYRINEAIRELPTVLQKSREPITKEAVASLVNEVHDMSNTDLLNFRYANRSFSPTEIAARPQRELTTALVSDELAKRGVLSISKPTIEQPYTGEPAKITHLPTRKIIAPPTKESIAEAKAAAQAERAALLGPDDAKTEPSLQSGSDDDWWVIDEINSKGVKEARAKQDASWAARIRTVFKDVPYDLDIQVVDHWGELTPKGKRLYEKLVHLTPEERISAIKKFDDLPDLKTPEGALNLNRTIAKKDALKRIAESEKFEIMQRKTDALNRAIPPDIYEIQDIKKEYSRILENIKRTQKELADPKHPQDKIFLKRLLLEYSEHLERLEKRVQLAPKKPTPDAENLIPEGTPKHKLIDDTDELIMDEINSPANAPEGTLDFNKAKEKKIIDDLESRRTAAGLKTSEDLAEVDRLLKSAIFDKADPTDEQLNKLGAALEKWGAAEDATASVPEAPKGTLDFSKAKAKRDALLKLAKDERYFKEMSDASRASYNKPLQSARQKAELKWRMLKDELKKE